MAENIISKIKIQNTEYDLKVVTDAILNSTSTNPIENQAVTAVINSLSDKLSNTNIAYATCDTAAATAAKVVTITGNDSWELTTGSIVMVKFTITNTASNVTLNVNSTGAYPIWYNNAEYTSTGSGYTGYADRVIGYMFNGTHWVWITSSYDSNTTYTNVKLGHGYTTCSTAAATKAKTAALSSYTLTTGGIVAIKFTYDVPANATLNINSKGAKAIYHKGVAITDGVIKAGDTATFIYSSQYHLISLNRDTIYTHPTTDGNKHIPSGGSSGQILKWSADGTAAWSSISYDSSLSETSTNAVQNQAVAAAIDNLTDTIDSLTKQDVGVFVQDSEPTSAAIGDIWIDTSISDLYSVEGVSF